MINSRAMKVPADKKRVPLNCLVRPDTKQEIQERATNGKSQGEVIDEAISALYRETGTAYDPHSDPSVASVLRVTETPRTPPKRPAKHSMPGWKGELRKPKDQKKG